MDDDLEPMTREELMEEVRRMSFVPIGIQEYVTAYVRRNSGSDPAWVRRRLQEALTAFKSGRRCFCGLPIWVIGSVDAGYMCFTCITGEADPSSDYEIDEAC